MSEATFIFCYEYSYPRTINPGFAAGLRSKLAIELNGYQGGQLGLSG